MKLYSTQDSAKRRKKVKYTSLQQDDDEYIAEDAEITWFIHHSGGLDENGRNGLLNYQSAENLEEMSDKSCEPDSIGWSIRCADMCVRLQGPLVISFFIAGSFFGVLSFFFYVLGVTRQVDLVAACVLVCVSLVAATEFKLMGSLEDQIASLKNSVDNLLSCVESVKYDIDMFDLETKRLEKITKAFHGENEQYQCASKAMKEKLKNLHLVNQKYEDEYYALRVEIGMLQGVNEDRQTTLETWENTNEKLEVNLGNLKETLKEIGHIADDGTIRMIAEFNRKVSAMEALLARHEFNNAYYTVVKTEFLDNEINFSEAEFVRLKRRLSGKYSIMDMDFQKLKNRSNRVSFRVVSRVLEARYNSIQN